MNTDKSLLENKIYALIIGMILLFWIFYSWQLNHLLIQNQELLETNKELIEINQTVLAAYQEIEARHHEVYTEVKNLRKITSQIIEENQEILLKTERLNDVFFDETNK